MTTYVDRCTRAMPCARKQMAWWRLITVTPLVPGAIDFSLELVLQSGDMFEQIIDTRGHERSLDQRNRTSARNRPGPTVFSGYVFCGI